MQYNNVELTVQIKGRPVTEYPHNGQVFVEGREGSTFEINVKNHNAFSVEAIVSVDGLSILDGKDAGPTSTGYLLHAHETIAIPGWTLDSAQVAAFQFAGKGGSYAAHATGSTRNTGVIGLMAYREKTKPYTFTPNFPHYPVGMRGMGAVSGGVVNSVGPQMLGLTGGIMRGMVSPTNAVYGGSDRVNVLSAIQNNASATACTSGLDTLIGASVTSQAATQSFNAVEQELGTAFGEATRFNTTKVAFDRGDMLAMIVLRYDSARALKSMGIDLSRRAKTQATQAPNAFPGMSGCTPPKGWQG